MSGKRRKRRPVGETIGGIIVGFDQQIFRTTPPVHELIAKAKPVRGVSGDDGTEFEVVFPDDDPAEPERAESPAAPESAAGPESPAGAESPAAPAPAEPQPEP